MSTFEVCLALSYLYRKFPLMNQFELVRAVIEISQLNIENLLNQSQFKYTRFLEIIGE